MANHKLYGALAAAIVQHTVDRFDYSQPVRTALARCSRVGPGGGTPALHSRPLIDEHGSILPDDTALYGVYRLAVDGSKTAALVTERASSRQFDMPPVGAVIAGWLSCADHFGVVSRGREPFLPDGDVQALV
jgi:hypothetical protein